MIREKESGETKEEYQQKRKGCAKLLEIYHHLHQQGQDKAYSAIRVFEVEQMTYAFSFYEVCKESRLEYNGTRNMCTCCRRDKMVP